MYDSVRLVRFTQKFKKFYVQQFGNLAAENKLTIQEIRVLLFLANFPGSDTAKDVTEFHGLAKSLVSQAVEKLAGRGFVTRDVDREDRRVVHLALTEAGGEIALACQKVQNDCYARLFRGFSPEEEKQFRGYMERVLKNGDTL